MEPHVFPVTSEIPFHPLHVAASSWSEMISVTSQLESYLVLRTQGFFIESQGDNKSWVTRTIPTKRCCSLAKNMHAFKIWSS